MKKCYKLLFLLLALPVFTYAQIDAADTIVRPASTANAFFAGIGLVNSSVSYAGNDGLDGAKSTGNVSPQINLGTDFYFDRYSKAIIFRVVLSYNPGSKATLTAKYGNDNIIEASLTQTTDVLKFTQNTASITPQLIWNFYNGDKFKVYIDAGFGVYANKFTNRSNTETVYYKTSGTQTTMQRAFPLMSSVSYNVPVQVGVMLSNHFNIYAGFISKTALNSEIDYEIATTRYLAGINYLFDIK